jgi:hypothetical protein
MPWYWTDDLAHILIERGTVEKARLTGWIVSPVAVRRDEVSAEDVAGDLLAEEDDDGPSTWAAAA